MADFRVGLLSRTSRRTLVSGDVAASRGLEIERFPLTRYETLSVPDGKNRSVASRVRISHLDSSCGSSMSSDGRSDRDAEVASPA